MATELEVFLYTDQCPRLNKQALQAIAQAFVEDLSDFGVKAHVEIVATTRIQITGEAGEDTSG